MEKTYTNVGSPTSAPCGPRNDSPRIVSTEKVLRPPISASLLVIVGASLFGTTGTAVSRVPGGADPWSTGSLRLLIGGFVLTLVAGRRMKSVRALPAPMLAGIVLVGVYQLAFFWSVTDTGVAVSTLTAIGVSPLVSRLIGIVRQRPTPRPWWFLSTVLLLIGLTTLVVGGYAEVEVRIGGVIVALVAGSAFAGYTECASVAIDAGAHPDAVLGGVFFGAGVLTAPLLAIRPLDVFETRTGVLVLCHLSLATLAIAYMAFGRGLRRLPPTSVTLLTIAEPLVATVLAVSVLDEQLSGVGWFGAVVLMSGLVAVATTTDETNATVRP